MDNLCVQFLVILIGHNNNNTVLMFSCFFLKFKALANTLTCEYFLSANDVGLSSAA